jgi:hypothetical protein
MFHDDDLGSAYIARRQQEEAAAEVHLGVVATPGGIRPAEGAGPGATFEDERQRVVRTEERAAARVGAETTMGGPPPSGPPPAPATVPELRAETTPGRLAEFPRLAVLGEKSGWQIVIEQLGAESLRDYASEHIPDSLGLAKPVIEGAALALDKLFGVLNIGPAMVSNALLGDYAGKLRAKGLTDSQINAVLEPFDLGAQLLVGLAAGASEPAAAGLAKLSGQVKVVAERAASILERAPGALVALGERGSIPLGAPRQAVRVIAETAEEAQRYAALDPGVISLGNKALKIDWSTLRDPEGIQEAIQKIVALRGEHIEAARRGVVTDDRVRQLADLLGVTPEDVLRRPMGQALNAEQILAVIDLVGANLRKIAEINMRYRVAPEGATKRLALQELQAQLGVTERLIEHFYGIRAEAGRSTRVFGTAQAQETLQTARQVEDIMHLYTRGLVANADRISDYLATLDRPEQRGGFLLRLGRAGKLTLDVLLESWINSLLLTFQGNMANLLSNVTTTVVGPFERYMAGVIGAVRRGEDANRVYIGEGTAMIKGALLGFFDALVVARRAARTGVSAFGTTKELPARALSAENLHLQGLPGRAVDFIGTLVTVPSRALLTADEFSKLVNYRMELWAQAYREARAQGLSGPELREFLVRFVTDPPPKVKLLAEEFANYQTFTKPLEGRLASMQSALSHPLARLVVPFFRTPVNIFTYGFERFPALGALVKHERDDILAGGARMDLAYARMSTGGLLLGTAALLAANGTISGRGPSEPNLRRALTETGWQPYSVKLGDTWIGYNRMDPLGMYFGLAADFAELAGEMHADEAHELAAAIGIAVSKNFLSKTYVEGLSDALETVVTHMSRGPQDIRDDYFKRLGASLVGVVPLAGQVIAAPGTAQIERQADPVVRETYSVMDRIASRVPGISDKLPPRRNLFGESVRVSPGVPEALSFLSPFPASTARTGRQADSFREIVQQQIPVEPPAKVLFGGTPSRYGDIKPSQGIPLTAEQYDRYVVLAGSEVRMRNQNLEAALAGLIKSPAYQKLADGPEGKGAMLREVILTYREAARVRLLKEFPELETALIQKQAERAAAKVGPRVHESPTKRGGITFPGVR